MTDCIIIGAGPAGMTAAIYLVRKKVNILVLSSSLGGQIMDGPLIENYPGFEKLSGPEWVSLVKAQADRLGVKFELEAEVTKIVKKETTFEIETKKEKFEAKSVIIASGKSPRKLGVSGEEEFAGRGISHCVTCDGPLFSGKTVAVIGGGNSAISAALEMEKYAEKVYIINLGAALVGEEVRIDQLKKSSKVEIIGQAKTMEIQGNKFVERLKYQDLTTKEVKEISCQGIIVEIGWTPSTNYLKGFVELTPTNEIKIDKLNATNVPGVFAAGDATEIPYKQLVIAAGQGANAAMSAWDWLSKQR